MAQARKEQVSLDVTPFYHCHVRCVRRAYLCGEDYSSGANYDHRKQWIVSRLKFLSYVYSIDICAYAVMSNHYHVVLHVDKSRAESWSREEVVERWLQLYKGNVLVDRWLQEPDELDKSSRELVYELIETWRARLFDIGWFMRGVNETIARMANQEENCKGRFWEGRYKSQALLDEAALLSCMAYVDLNPVRAGISEDLAESDFTSIQQRLYDYVKDTSVNQKQKSRIVKRVEKQKKLKVDLGLEEQPEKPLMPFDGSSQARVHSSLPFTRKDYLELVDQTGRIICEGKRAFIAADVPPLIMRFGINPDKWINYVLHFGRRYSACVGSVEKMREFAQRFGRNWAKGVRESRVIGIHKEHNARCVGAF